MGLVLLERFKLYHSYVLAFMNNSEFPFTNNQAERDLRMLKVQQKVSGQFKSFKGFAVHARIRSFISTLKKRKMNVMEQMRLVFEDPLSIQNQIFKKLTG